MSEGRQEHPTNSNEEYIAYAEAFLPEDGNLSKEQQDLIFKLGDCIINDASLEQIYKTNYTYILELICLQPGRAFSQDEKITLGKVLVKYLEE